MNLQVAHLLSEPKQHAGFRAERLGATSVLDSEAWGGELSRVWGLGLLRFAGFRVKV